MKKIISFLIITLILFSLGNRLVSLAEETTTTTTNETTTTTTTIAPTTTTTSTTTTTLPPLIVKPLFKGINPEDLKQSLTIQEKTGWRLGQVSIPVSKDNTIVHLKAGKLVELSENLIKVEIFGYTYKVDISSSNLYRQGWGKSDIDEFSIGDVINVYGYLDNNDNYLIHAINVRDMSILLTHYVFKGVIKSIDSNSKSFVLNTIQHGDLTVNVYSETKIIKFSTTTPSYTEGSFSDLEVNSPVIVRGVYNINQKKIDANLIIVGNDERPFFKNQLKIKNQIQNREQFSTEGQEIRNQLREQIQNLQKLFEMYRNELKKRGI